MCSNTQETANLVIFTEEILNEKLRFLCSVNRVFQKYFMHISAKITIVTHSSILDVAGFLKCLCRIELSLFQVPVLNLRMCTSSKPFCDIL